MSEPTNQSNASSNQTPRSGFWKDCGWLKAIVAIGCFAYVLARVLKLPLGPDEWEVLKDVHEHGFADWVLFLDWNSQNHLLNLLLSKVCYLISTRNELQMVRIPSLLALALYEWAAWRITKHLASPFLSVVAFATLLLNPFVLDYFGLSRGYGLALAFTLWSLSAVRDLIQKPGRTSGAHWLAHLSACAAFLAAISSIAYIPLYATILVILVLLWVKRWLSDRETHLRNILKDFIVDNLFLVAYSGILAGICLPRLVFLQRTHPLESASVTGGNTGLIADTVTALIESVFYDVKLPGALAHSLAWGAVVLVLIFGVISLVRRYVLKRNSQQLSTTVCMFLFLLIAAVGLETLHVFFKYKYPVEGRMLLYLVFGFFLQIIFFADEIRRGWLRIPLFGILISWIILGGWNLNLSHTREAQVFSDIPTLIQDLKAIHDQSGQPVVLCMGDNWKWAAWYYGEKTVGVKESERLREYGCAATISWLSIYETYCGRSRDGQRNFAATTTHFFIGPEDEPLNWIPKDVNLGGGLTLSAKPATPQLVAQYPVSHWRLYARE